MFASIVGYQTALLLDRGFSNGEAGLMTSVRCLAGIVCQPLLGLCRPAPGIPLKRIVSLSMLFSLGVSVWYWLAPGMGLGRPPWCGRSSAGWRCPPTPSWTPWPSSSSTTASPSATVWAGDWALAYALTCVFLGFQVGRSGVESTLLTHVVLVAAEIALVATYPALPGQAPRPGCGGAEATVGPGPAAVQSVLYPDAGRVLLSLTAVLPLSNFLVNIVTSRGGTDADLGLAMFVMGAFRLPTAFLFPRLLRRFGSGRLLVLSAVFGTLKAVALLCTFNYAGVLLAQPLQLLGYGLFTPASVYFVNESVPEADRVRGQTVMMVASNGMGGMLGGLLGRLDLGYGRRKLDARRLYRLRLRAALYWAALRCPARRTV